MIRNLRQTNFEKGTGDCFATCVAMVLGLEQADVPNFCATGMGWWSQFLVWLQKHNLTAVEIPLTTDAGQEKPRVLSSRVVAGTPCILSGKSPQGDWLHAVVATVNGDGFDLVADPNPSDKFIDDIQYVTYFVALRPDLVRTMP